MKGDWNDHERFIAKVYGGQRTKGSGSGIKEKGDVRIEEGHELVECKLAGNTDKPRRSKVVKDFEKIAKEAYEEGRDPVLALRYFDPESFLARDGFVDFSVRLVRDDARRTERLRNVPEDQ